MGEIFTLNSCNLVVETDFAGVPGEDVKLFESEENGIEVEEDDRKEVEETDVKGIKGEADVKHLGAEEDDGAVGSITKL